MKRFQRGFSVWATLVSLLSFAPLGAQASLQGIVTNQVSGEPLQGAGVVLQPQTGAARNTFTDRNGYYQFGGLPAATYTLTISSLGYTPFEQILTLDAARQTVSAGLILAPVALQGVSAAAAMPQGPTRRQLGRQTITPGDLRLVPVPSGSGDLASYLQTLPGVISTGDRGGQLFIRGGTPAENLSLVDGTIIYQPFHIIGFFSAFPEDLVESVDFYAGGFGARYTGRTSSVLDVRMRDGNRTNVAGTATVSPFVVEAVAEGPVGGGRGSWIVAGRRSVIEEVSPTLLEEEQPIGFNSQLVKVTSFGDGGARCSAMGMRTVDEGRMDNEDLVSHVGWNNIVAGGRCTLLFNEHLRLLEVSFGYSSADNDAVTRGASKLTSRITKLSHEAHTTNLFRTYPVYAGYHFSAENISYDVTELFSDLYARESVMDVGGYVETSIPIAGRAELRPGVVINLLPTTGFDGRLRASWRPFGSAAQEINGALGAYRQDITGVTDQRDVASVFTAWSEPRSGGPLKSYHAILGWQQQLGAGLSWSLEGYYKEFRNVPVPIWRAAVEYATQLTRAEGETRGADLRLEYAAPHVYAYAGYGYGWTQYEVAQETFDEWYGEPTQTYHPQHDRRHQANALVSYEFKGFTGGARWQMGTGFPFTKPFGFDEAFNFQAFLEDVRRRGQTRLVVERPFGGRLPMMHRLDVSLKRSFDIGIGNLEAQAGAINAYDRPNMFFYDLQTNRRIDQLPLTPYLSLRLEAL